ncbi:MAG: flagellar protein FlaG [Thiohalomonadales bacterium]
MSANMNTQGVVSINTNRVNPVSKVATSAEVNSKDVDLSLPDAKPIRSVSDAEKVQPSEGSTLNNLKRADPDITQDILDINDYVQNTQRSLNFSVDEESGKTIVKVIDTETKETIRQIPSEEIVTMAEQIRKYASKSGNLFEAKA